MAYEIIRHTEFPGKDGAGYALDLLENGGTPITLPDDEATGELQLAAEPIVATYQMGDLPYGLRILNVELHLLNETTLMQAIRGGDEEQYRLRLTKGGFTPGNAWGSRVTSGVVQWVVKVRPKDTQRIIQDRVALQIIHAGDGLDQLQYYPFLNDSGELFTGRQDLGDIIHTILNKLGLSLGFVHMSNWYAKSGNNTPTADPLTDSTEACRIDQEWIYERIREQSGGLDGFGRLRKQMTNLLRTMAASREPEEDPPSCYDVLNLILEEWQLVLYQAAGGWWIEQYAERENATTPYIWLYNSGGTLTDSGSSETTSAGTLGIEYEDTETAGVPDSDYHQIGEATERQLPALTSVTVRYLHDAISAHIIPSNGFRDWDSATGYPRGWARNSTSVAIDPEQREIENGIPGMMYNNDLETFLTWADVKGDADYMYNAAASTPTITITAGDVITFEFDALYTFDRPFADIYNFVAYAQVLEINSGKYLSWTNDTSGSAVAPGNWSTDSDNRIDLFRSARATSGNTSPLLSATIETSTTLGLPTGACEFKIFLYKGVDLGYKTPGAPFPAVGYLDRLIWGAPNIIYQPQDAPENEETVRTGGVSGQSGVEKITDRIFYFGSGPVVGGNLSRITYGSSDTDPTNGQLALDSGTGTGIDHISLWITELLKLRRAGPLTYKRTLRCTANAPEGEHHFFDSASNYYYFHRLIRLYKSGIAGGEWVELRQDSPTVDFEDVTRDWPKKRRPDDEPGGGFEYAEPFERPGCLLHAGSGGGEALYPMVEALGAPQILINDFQFISENPNGTLAGSIANWTWGDAGLSKTSTGTTEYVQLPNDLLGSTTPARLTVFNQLRRDTTSEISVWRVTAGTQTVIECKILTTGVVRLAIVDETGASTNIDSTATIGSGEWASVGHSIVPFGSYTTIYAYTLNKDDAEPIQTLAIISDNVSLDFTDIKMFYSNELTIRLSHWLVQAWTKSMFLAEALCARTFTTNEGVDPGEVTNPQPALLFRTDAGIEIYDLGGTQAYDWADATNVPGGIVCRPAWHPGNSKVFYGADEDVVSADIDGSNIVVEYSAAADVKIRGLQYAPGNGRLYLIKAKNDFSSPSFGYLSGSPGAMSYNELSTAFDAADFFANASHNVLVYEDLSDDDLYALILNTFVQLDTATEANLAGVWYTQTEQGAYFMDTGGDVYRQFVANVPLFATTQVQMVEGSGFTSPRPNTLMIHEDSGFSGLMFLVANDHVMVAPLQLYEENPALMTSASFADIATLGDVCRGASLAQIAISPSLAAPVLVLGTETATTVPLTWADIAGETNYVLQQATAGATGPFTTINSPAQDATGYTVTGLTPETPYWFRVRGHNAAGAGPWSNVVAATTEALSEVALIGKIVGGGADVIEIVSLEDGSIIDSLTLGKDFPALSGVGIQLVAYSAAIDRILYIAQGATYHELRSIKTDGTSDTVAYTFTSGKTPYCVWALSNGAVWCLAQNSGTAAWMRWAPADINLDTTWDAPSTDEAGGDLYAQPSIDAGTGEGVTLVGRTGGASGAIYRLLDYTNWPGGITSWKNETADIVCAFHDIVGDRVFYYLPVSGTANDTIQVMADSAAAADSTVITMTNGDSPHQTLFYDGALWLYYYSGAGRYVRRCEDDGANDEAFYDSGSTNTLKGLVIADIS